MNIGELNATARALVAKNRGILAADESGSTIKKRFDTIKLESTEENRRAYREMLFTAPGAQSYIRDRKSTRLNSSHQIISYAVFCLKKKKTQQFASLAHSRHQ